MQLSQTALASAIGVPPRRINEIVLGKRAVVERWLLLHSLYLSSSGLARGSSDQRAPEQAERWIVGTSPTMTALE
jgi:hypothetical protein